MTSTRMKTALKILDAINKMDMDTILSVRSPNCIQIYAPSSHGAPPPRDNAAYAALLSGFTDVAKEMPLTTKEIMEDEKQNRVIVWCSGVLRFKDIVKDPGLSDDEWEYHGEYIFILSMDESGEKVERSLEFVDSKATERLRILMARAHNNLVAAKAGAAA